MLYCEIVKFPNNIIYGINTATSQFIGFNPLLDLLTKIKNDVSNISSVQNNFNNIKNLNLPKSSKDGMD